MKNIVRYLYAAGMVAAIWVVFHVLLGHGIVWVILLTIASLAIYYFFSFTSDEDNEEFQELCIFGGLAIVLMYFTWWILRDVLSWGWFWVVLIECPFATVFGFVFYNAFLSVDPSLIAKKWIKIKDVFLLFRRKDYSKVIDLFENDEHYEATTLHDYCKKYKKLANIHVWSAWHEKGAAYALKLIKDYESSFSVPSWNTIKGLDYKGKGQYEKALECFKSAKNTSEITNTQSILDRIAEEEALKAKQIADIVLLLMKFLQEEEALKAKKIAEEKARVEREANMCKSAFEKKDYRTIVQLFKNNDNLAKDENVVSCYIRALWALGKTTDTLSCIDEYSSIFDTTQWNDIRAEHQYNNGNYWEASEYYKSANMNSEAGKMEQLAISEDKKEMERQQYYYNQGAYDTVVKRFETNKYQSKYKTAVGIYIRALYELGRFSELAELIPQYNTQFSTKEWNVYFGHYYRQEEEYDKALEMYQSAGCKDEADEIKQIIQNLEQQKVEYLQTFNAKQYGQVIKTFEATPKWNTDIKLVDAYIRSNWELDKSTRTIDILAEYAKKFDTDQWDEIRGIYCESQEDYVQAHQWYKSVGRTEDCVRVEGKEIDRLLAQIKSLRSNGYFGQIIELLESAEFWNKSKDIIDIYLESVYKQEGPSERLYDLATQFDGQHHCNQWQKYKAMYYEKESLFAKAAECYKIAGMNDKFIAMQKAEKERVRRAEEERRHREEEERRRREEEERRRREEEERRRREEEERKQKEQKIQRMNEAMENEDWYDAIHLFENDSFYKEQNECKKYYVAALIRHGDYDEAYEAAQQYRGALDDDDFYVCKGYYYLSNGDIEEAEKYFRWGHADRLVQQVKEIREAQDDDSWSYGSSSSSERTIYTGKRGGRYYINDKNEKVYVDRDR